MSTRHSLYLRQAINKRGRIDPGRRPLRSQPIPHKPGKVVVQMVVYIPGTPVYKPVMAWILKASSEATPSVLHLRPWPAPEGSEPLGTDGLLPEAI
jgi:hypothetical protein